MNILTIINKLKEKQFLPDTEEGMNLFSDCFNKFGISLLLLKEEYKFSAILDLLKENNIPLQKANGMFALRIFAVDINELKEIIDKYAAIEELDFLRQYPEIMAEAQTVHNIVENMKKYQEKNVSYKDGNTYNIVELINYEEKEDETNVEGGEK